MSGSWGFVGAIAFAMLCALLSGEIKAGARALAKRLILNASGRIYAASQERYREEWLANLDYKTQEGRDLGQLVWAIDIWAKVRIINQSLEGPDACNLTREELQRQIRKHVVWVTPLWRLHGVMMYVPLVVSLGFMGIDWLIAGKFDLQTFKFFWLGLIALGYVNDGVMTMYRYHNRRTLHLCLVFYRRYDPESPWIAKGEEALARA